MEEWISTLTLWLQNLSIWIQNLTGMSTKDVSLFLGGILTVMGMLWLGLYSGKPRYREAARFGWFLLMIAFVFICWGLYNHNPGSD